MSIKHEGMSLLVCYVPTDMTGKIMSMLKKYGVKSPYINDLYIGEKLRYWRNKKQLTQLQLAQMAGYTSSNVCISEFENNKRPVPVMRLFQFAEIFGIDVDQLVS